MTADLRVEATTGKHRAQRRWRAAAVGVALAAAFGIGWWYAHSAEVFDTSGSPVVSVNVATAGTPYSVGVIGGQLPAVTVNAAHVILGEGAGSAAVSAVVCDLGSVGATAGPLAPFASGCRDLANADLGGMPDTAQIIVTVVPLENEAVEVKGLRLEFQDGWRRGSQTLPISFRVAVPT